ncbi:MAG: 50S ribosomal protein L35 [Micavibrio aeruginosavorus]|uniref:Large ribosomal subunit protein bL35 n=1 Tax=Micavibrio aeruginosavorus TaxID=349221 RepID=A0A2W5MX63_9BACT|nr:MAG: 50S ribosomal protein L35 [Micavibrio aeruginosavorus]
MPKMKTKSSAKKRFSITASGKVKFKQANKGHRLMQKPKSAKRKAKGTETMAHGDAQKVLQSFMPYARAKVSSTKKKEAPAKAVAAKTKKGAE